MFKKITIAIIVLLAIFVGYIGFHRVKYNTDYKTIATLTEDIYRSEQNIIKYQTDVDSSKAALDTAKKSDNTVLENRLDLNLKDFNYKRDKKYLDDIQELCKKDKLELAYLKNKTKYFKFLKP